MSENLATINPEGYNLGMGCSFWILLFQMQLATTSVLAKKIVTNAVVINNAPEWLSQPRVERITDRIQSKLEWMVRKINVTWYSTEDSYLQVHKFGPQAAAFTRTTDTIASVHMGPKVTTENFDSIFGHELTHVIVFQKYKGAIPKWLEEGLANHLSKTEKVDYKWLAKQQLPNDVTQLAHPFSGSADGVSARYKASQALAEMLDKKCDLENLIRLSVTRKMEPFIKTYCEISDINQTFRKWIEEKAKAK